MKWVPDTHTRAHTQHRESIIFFLFSLGEGGCWSKQNDARSLDHQLQFERTWMGNHRVHKHKDVYKVSRCSISYKLVMIIWSRRFMLWWHLPRMRRASKSSRLIEPNNAFLAHLQGREKIIWLQSLIWNRLWLQLRSLILESGQF